MAKTPCEEMKWVMASSGRISSISLHSALEDLKFAEHARWIAIVIATWQRIETQLFIAYSMLLDIEYRRALIAWHAMQNHRSRIKAISAALHELVSDDVIVAQWKTLQPDIKKAKHLRDTFAHAQWEPNPKKNHVLEMRSTYVEETFSERTVPYPLNNIKANAAQVCGIGGDVSQFVVALVRLVRPQLPWPEKSE